jgi:hypothetical protein
VFRVFHSVMTIGPSNWKFRISDLRSTSSNFKISLILRTAKR